MKVIKFLLKTVLWIVAILVVALLAMPLWFGPVVKTTANAVAPGIVKTDFHLNHIHLNPYTARFELRDLRLSNPEGYSEKYAATVGDITFDAATLSLVTDVIHIEEITVKDIFVSYVSGGTGKEKVNNFQQIQYNVAGGKEKYEQAQAEKKRLAEAEAQKPQAEEPQVAEKEKPAKKVIIDKLHISGLKIQLGFLPIVIPGTLELTDIGKDSGGASMGEIRDKIWQSILKAAGNVGDAAKAVGKALGDATAQASEAANKAAAQATEALGNATEGATKAAAQATESVGKAASAVTDSAANATKAAGEAAGKAIDSLKKLW